MENTRTLGETLAAAIAGMAVAAAFLSLYAAMSAPVLRVLSTF